MGIKYWNQKSIGNYFHLQVVWLLCSFMEPTAAWPAWGNIHTMLWMGCKAISPKDLIMILVGIFNCIQPNHKTPQLWCLSFFLGDFDQLCLQDWPLHGSFQVIIFIVVIIDIVIISIINIGTIAVITISISREMGIKMHRGVKSFWKVVSQTDLAHRVKMSILQLIQCVLHQMIKMYTIKTFSQTVSNDENE